MKKKLVILFLERQDEEPAHIGMVIDSFLDYQHHLQATMIIIVMF